MSTCPLCHAELPDDFGLIECPGCEASLFIEMDGSVQSPTQSSEAGFEDPSNFYGEDSELESESHENQDMAFSESENYGEETFDENFQQEDMSENPDPSSELEEFSAAPPVEEESAFEEPEFGGDPMEDAPLEVADPVAGNLAQVDISDLATTMDEQGASEALTYDLMISGIDTADLRKEVLESLTDKRLAWDPEALVNEIKEGHLKLTGISAIKAHVVAQRLKVLPLHLEWKQYGDL
ncbi:MAG TPA: hypothetical protein DCL41_06605 [Bdellovibrionales bacterium]|nr:hypothetical protein [Pseudobdellovibrionaceae bacterium]HAG91522.1 hypothetical protein [Bdellovibrionales bacterium]|tara:strand:+ start:656 stop:1369 length:714 start_codon:yes stop_codon:yes gene_type:complete